LNIQNTTFQTESDSLDLIVIAGLYIVTNQMTALITLKHWVCIWCIQMI